MTAAVPDAAAIEGLDFEHVPPCEIASARIRTFVRWTFTYGVVPCGEPADWFVRWPCCGHATYCCGHHLKRPVRWWCRHCRTEMRLDQLGCVRL